MEKETRSAIERATQKVRGILERDFSEQLQGDYDVMPDGRAGERPGAHLTGSQRALRSRIVAATEHKRAQGMKADEAVADFLRDAAFTTMNRFVALKMLEARGLVQECVSKGEASSGFANEFCGLAPGLKFADGSGYRLYIESVFDELSTEVKVLFDRRDPASALWPRRAAFDEMLAALNADELKGVWGEDETIGWVYQYFNGQDERRRMREESQAPRNSRELAVRNQFFTPRYVVQFLTDNTLGRIWYEMRDSDTALAERCEYMVRKPGETFAMRAKKDPRDLRVLDPACGSGHFLLYAFDLLLTIYEEAYADLESPKSEATGRRLREDYESLNTLRKAVPGLVLANNLHGVDIDPRCAQIAQLALWMRAQRAFRDFGVDLADRPPIRRANIVIAEPMPGEKDLLQDFLAGLKEDRLEDLMRRALDIPSSRKVKATKEMAKSLGELVETVWDGMKLAGEMGTLLRIEREIADAVAKGRAEWEERLPLFNVTYFGAGAPTGEQLVKLVPGEGEDFWAKAERLVFCALADYAEEAGASGNVRRRLFAEDAAQGFGLVDLVSKKFEAVVMNPPFGSFSTSSRSHARDGYPTASTDILAAFVLRALEMLTSCGYFGAITSRTGFFNESLSEWRRFAFEGRRLRIFADLGENVLDDAMVEVAAYTASRSAQDGPTNFIRAVTERDKAIIIQIASMQCNNRNVFVVDCEEFMRLRMNPFAYWVHPRILAMAASGTTLEPDWADVRSGLQTNDDNRFVRLRWEIASQDIMLKAGRERAWVAILKSDEAAAWFSDISTVLKWHQCGRELKALVEHKGNSITRHVPNESYYFKPGVSWVKRSTRCIPTLVPSGVIPTVSRYVAYPRSGREGMLLGLLASDIVSAVLRWNAEKFVWPIWGTRLLKNLWVPEIEGSAAAAIEEIVQEHVKEVRKRLEGDETSSLFCGLEEGRVERPNTLSLGALGSVESVIHEAYGLSVNEANDVINELKEAIDYRTENKLIEESDGDDGEIQLSSVTSFHQHLSYALGVLFGRWDYKIADVKRKSLDADIFVFQTRPPAYAINSPLNELVPEISVAGMLHDDNGDIQDIVQTVARIWIELANRKVGRFSCTKATNQEIRNYLSHEFFNVHIRQYTACRRKAPIYWQLATRSAGYSVWLYIHAFTRDTLFRVQNDYLAPKLAQEARRLGSMKSELGDGGTAAQRKTMAAHEAFVDELRAFLEEVARVAPLWNFDLDDGVIINFAPLWRLVPQHKPWQKELKATWDALSEGKYDWAHLAMHLWPERVVPKCADDRSLAIAHGLEDVFWVEGEGGKWKSRSTPSRPVDELVAERSSAAVKAALKSLMEAPDQTGPAKRCRKSKAA
ncbi:hypothetical protein DFR50_10196 [Roseiarcus fermentans]|uniref:site-specific DNA-methyltransferase (adenine-specific) n=1 Tax=Roseiarcus fermentans TaxID=1473586 RepID=A0A366FTZ6_9HYPH|nr:BREX-1 system adenine-specific DNA-methyltransferase PglX [Roseiarcus fermentans]RBP18152.1 hypothetical protein DFR50_10196 [Roseiarcus fermentans]